MLDHIESYCDLAFDSNGEEIERKWGPKLKVTEWSGKPTKGNKWLRDGQVDDDRFTSHMTFAKEKNETDGEGNKRRVSSTPLIIVNPNG